MNEQELDKVGRTLAGALRHFPESFNLDMDEQGFVDMREFVSALKQRNDRYHWLRPHHIIAVIETDPKGRYQISNNEMRATYGHSIDLELNLPTNNIPEELYYPTTPEEVDIILETGLKPSDRSMVHLSKTYEKAVEAGQVRVDSPVILAIDTEEAIQAGFEIQEAGKTVYLAKEIPPEYLSRAEEG